MHLWYLSLACSLVFTELVTNVIAQQAASGSFYGHPDYALLVVIGRIGELVLGVQPIHLFISKGSLSDHSVLLFMSTVQPVARPEEIVLTSTRPQLLTPSKLGAQGRTSQ